MTFNRKQFTQGIKLADKVETELINENQSEYIIVESRDVIIDKELEISSK